MLWKNDFILGACYLKWLGMEVLLSPFIIRKNFSQHMFSEGKNVQGILLQNFAMKCLHLGN